MQRAKRMIYSDKMPIEAHSLQGLSERNDQSYPPDRRQQPISEHEDDQETKKEQVCERRGALKGLGLPIKKTRESGNRARNIRRRGMENGRIEPRWISFR